MLTVHELAKLVLPFPANLAPEFKTLLFTPLPKFQPPTAFAAASSLAEKHAMFTSPMPSRSTTRPCNPGFTNSGFNLFSACQDTTPRDAGTTSGVSL